MPDEVVQTPTQEPSYSEKMASQIWGDTPTATPPQAQVATTPTVAPEQAVVTPTPEEEFETLDAPEWLKREFGVDDVSVLKNEREEYRKLKEQKPFEFKDDYSRNFFQSIKEGKEDAWYDYLHNKKTIDRLEKLEVKGIKEAQEIIKANMLYKHKDLTGDDVDFLYGKKYTLPKQPSQALDQTDEEYGQALESWKQQVAEKEREIIIEAKLAKPELLQYKSQLVLPDIPARENQVAAPSQEDLQKKQAYKDSFLSSANESLNKFNGFSSKVSNKDVEIPLSYGLSQDEKKFIGDKINAFAENGYDVNALFADAWVNEDNTINSAKMIEDLSRLYFGDKVSQKYANDSANQRLEMYLKEKKNININEQNGQRTVPLEQKTQSQLIAEQFWG